MRMLIVLPVVLFSLSHSKRPQYILPLLPAVAILAGKVWGDAEEGAAELPPAAEELPDLLHWLARVVKGSAQRALSKAFAP